MPVSVVGTCCYSCHADTPTAFRLVFVILARLDLRVAVFPQLRTGNPLFFHAWGAQEANKAPCGDLRICSLISCTLLLEL